MFKRLSTRMFVFILSIIIFSLLALSYASYDNSRKIIQGQIQTNMDAELRAQVNLIDAKMQEVSVMASLLAKNVQTTYRNTSLELYENVLGDTIYENDIVLGSGIWFEPNVYDKNEKYVGPYVYKDGDKAVTTYEYSNEEYDYFQYSWYTNAMSGTKDPVFSELYYDETLGTTMTSCTAPMFDKDGSFIGVVTVDIELSGITNLINEIKVGEHGTAVLLTQSGIYITHQDQAMVMQATIVDSENKSLADLGKEILKKDNGSGSFASDGREYYAYYATVKDFNWKIIIQIPKAEIEAPLRVLLSKLVTIGAVMLLLSVLFVVLQVRYLIKNIKKVSAFAFKLSEGDFTVSELDIKSKDELGQMGNALNSMLSANKSIIQTIVNDSKQISEVSNQLDDSINNLSTSYEAVEDSIKAINENMMSTSAATEEVNASVEEVTASIVYLAQETARSYDMASEIKDRAANIRKTSEEAYEQALQLSAEKENNLNKSLKEAEIIDSIGVMADDISNIAEQVNLLSLNASIEAARAGEHGKGFSVVAKEIGVLAARTSSSVADIQKTVSMVRDAIDHLMLHSKQLLEFIKETVTPDYMKFVNVSIQYGKDANDIGETVTKIKNMSQNMEHVVSEVGDAIQSITEVTQSTSMNSNTIISSMEDTSELIDLITKMVDKEREIASNLDAIVNKFRL